jgi:hypothetical protein
VSNAPPRAPMYRQIDFRRSCYVHAPEKKRYCASEDDMANYDRNSGEDWTSEEVDQLKALAKENTPTRVIGLKLGRTEDAVRSKAAQENVSLKPVNQAPNG